MHEKRFHIFFHDDIDGIVSAAMVLTSFVRKHSYRLYPVKSAIRGDKFNKLIEKVEGGDNNTIIIVDYQFNERAHIWVDHHFDKDLGNHVVKNGKLFYDPNAKSAARVIYNWFQDDPILKGTINPAIITMVDLIDSAGYASVDYVFSSLEPLMILKAYIERLSVFVDSTFSRLVELISLYNFDINKVLFTLGVDYHIIHDLKQSAESIEKVMVINGCMGVTEMNRLYAYPRYAEFFVRPDVKYCVRIINLGGERIHIDIGYNSWHVKPNHLHIGKMLGALDYPISGGGHPGVGGAIIHESDLERFIDDACVQINGPEDSVDMEKYAVDKTDPIEEKADEMVKTGQAESKDKAREEAVKKEEGGKPEDVQGTDI